MAGVASVIFDIRAGVAKLNQDFARAEKRVDAGMKRVGSVMRKASVALAAYMGGRAVTAMVAQTSALASEMTYMSQRTGVAVETLMALRHGAETSGASFNNLQRGLKNISEWTAAGAAGAENFAAKYKRFGIEIQNADGTIRAADEVLADVADRLAAMPDGAAKTEAAMRLVGVEAGPKLLVMLNQGRAGLEAFRKEADALGITMSTENARALEAFGTNMDRLKRASKGVGQAIVSGLAQSMEAVTDRMVAAASGAERFAKIQEWARGIAEALILTIDVLAAGVRILLSEFGRSFGPVGSFNEHISETARVAKDLDAGLHSLALVMRTLGSVGRVVGWVFQVVGKALAGVLGSIWYAVTGRFKQAMEIATLSGQDMVDSTVNAFNDLKDTWTTSSKSVVASAKDMGLGLSQALDAVRGRAGGVTRAMAGVPPVMKETGKAAKEAAEELRKLDAIAAAHRDTLMLVAQADKDQVRQIQLRYQEEVRLAEEALAKKEIAERDFHIRIDALRRLEAQEIDDFHQREAEARDAALKKQLDEAQRQSDEARDVGFGIAGAITSGLKDGFEGDDFKDVFKSVVTMFSNIAMLIPGGQAIGMAGSLFAGLFKDGGLIKGPGSGTSDSILARVSAGEYVNTADSVKRFGPEFFERLNEGFIDLSTIPAYAGGGLVGGAPGSGGGVVSPRGEAHTSVYISAMDPKSTAEVLADRLEPAQMARGMARQDEARIRQVRARIHRRSGRQ